MKNYIFLSLLILFSFSSFSYAVETGTWTETKETPKNIKTEEDLCFEILTENINSQYNINIASVEESAEEWNIIDLSTYESFKTHTVINDKQVYLKNSGLNLFAAKRNNIWTIKANGDYILSQFAWFWNKTNFTFPLKSSNTNYSNGDLYPDFRQNIIYTHHLLDGTFVSCGFLKVKPQWSHDLYSIWQWDYKTNKFNWSWFELLKNSEKREWKDWEKEFLVWKVNVAADDYSDSSLFKINLLTVAYNNRSSYFNEFETFPKQVASMTNADSQKNGMTWVMINFFNKVKDETCLKLVHTSNSYPSKCWNKAQSLSFVEKIFNFFIPSTHASIQPVDNYKIIMNKSRGIVMYDWLPLELYEKIMKINDINLRNSLIAAILPNFEDIIDYKNKNKILLSPYEEVFSKCDMVYSERMINVIDFVKNLDITNVDYDNFSYLNKKFWDCVIPYPDKENIGKDIDNSFSKLIENKLNKFEWEKNILQVEVDQKFEEINSLENEFRDISEKIQNKIDSWEKIESSVYSEYNTERDEYNVKHDNLKNELKELIKKSNNFNTTLDENKSIEDNESTLTIDENNELVNNNSSNNYIYYLLIVIFLLIWFIFIKLAFSKK